MSPPARRPSATLPGRQPGGRRQQRCPPAGPAGAAAARERRGTGGNQARACEPPAFPEQLLRYLPIQQEMAAGRQASRGTRRTRVAPSFRLSCAFCPLTSTSSCPTSRSTRTAGRAGRQAGRIPAARHRHRHSGQAPSFMQEHLKTKACQAAGKRAWAEPWPGLLCSLEVGLPLMKQRLRTLPSAPAHNNRQCMLRVSLRPGQAGRATGQAGCTLHKRLAGTAGCCGDLPLLSSRRRVRVSRSRAARAGTPSSPSSRRSSGCSAAATATVPSTSAVVAGGRTASSNAVAPSSCPKASTSTDFPEPDSPAGAHTASEAGGEGGCLPGG